MKINPLFLIDFYKADHRRQYPEGTEYVYSNFTPRSNKYAYPGAKEVVVFGIQYLIKEYLIKLWNENFFQRNREEVIDEYKTLMDRCLGPGAIPVDHIGELHDLGYLPILIKALPEGSLCPIGVPCLTIRNTEPKFFWLTNYLETLLSNILWKPMTSASTAYMYRKEFERHAKKTGSPKDFILWQGHDFSFRGMSGVEDACMSGGGHLISFNGTDTVPAIKWIDEYYPSETGQLIGGSVPATEHSVMCMGGDGEGELATFKRLITEVYPHGIVSIVSDTWDFWKVVSEYLPTLKEEILNRDGRLVIRPDSGDPVEIICGLPIDYEVTDPDDIEYFTDEPESFIYEGDTPIFDSFDADAKIEIYKAGEEYYKITYVPGECIEARWDGSIFDADIENIEKIPSYVVKGAYEMLWDIFGGTVNEKGYKILNPKIGLIYGDSITYERQKSILYKLEEKGFTASNLVLGIGSFTYEYVTRDTYGFAMKATWGMVNGSPKNIYKDPVTDSGLKKSAKGLLCVKNGVLINECQDGEEETGDLVPVFEDGKLLKDFSIDEVRKTLWS